MKTSKARKPDKPEFTFKAKAATIAVNFFERLLRHTKGEWAGKPFALPPWQKKIIRELFGWKRADGTRRYRTAYIEIPRKNGKSTLSAGIALYLLFADDEPGAEIYSAAADRDQAAIVFEQARQMFDASSELTKRGKAYRRVIFTKGMPPSTYRVLSADAPTKHGLNAHGIIFDELHAQPNRELWDVLTTATGARRQPLVVAITTAGFDRKSICWEQHEYARKVLNGTINDPTFYAFVAAADEKDDWQSPRVWVKANPSLGITVKLDYLETECKRAQQSPAYQNTFRRLHLNQWTQQETRWLDISYWDACGEPFDARLLEGAACFGGLDLANSSDIAALVLDFPHESGEQELHTLLPFFWIPAENMVQRARKDRVPYDAWVRDGLMFATPGNVIDFDFILAHIEELQRKYDIKRISFDRWGAVHVSTRLIDMFGKDSIVGFGQGFASMSAPTKDLLRLVLDKRLRHGGHAVLRWMADNVVVSSDASGNVKPNRDKSREKIDGVVASIMALDGAMRRHENESEYLSRGLRVV